MTTPDVPQRLQPAGVPPTSAGWIHGVVQTASGLGLAVGLYLLLGLEWALVIASAVTFTGSIVLETMARRPPRPPAAPAPGGDR